MKNPFKIFLNLNKSSELVRLQTEIDRNNKIIEETRKKLAESKKGFDEIIIKFNSEKKPK